MTNPGSLWETYTTASSVAPVEKSEQLDGVIRNIYEADHDTLGAGTLFEIIHCTLDKKDDIPAGTPVAYRFFPDKIKNGAIYAHKRDNPTYSDSSLDDFCDAHDIGECEADETKVSKVRNYTNFDNYLYLQGEDSKRKDNNVRFFKHGDGTYHCTILVSHKLILPNGTIKRTKWLEEGPAGYDTQADAWRAWKSHFFAKFPGMQCKCSMKA